MRLAPENPNDAIPIDKLLDAINGGLGKNVLTLENLGGICDCFNSHTYICGTCSPWIGFAKISENENEIREDETEIGENETEIREGVTEIILDDYNYHILRRCGSCKEKWVCVVCHDLKKQNTEVSSTGELTCCDCVNSRKLSQVIVK